MTGILALVLYITQYDISQLSGIHIAVIVIIIIWDVIHFIFGHSRQL